MFPCFCSYDANAASASATEVKNLVSCAYVVFGAFNGVDAVGSGPKDCRAENRHRKAETERTADAAQSHSHSRHVASVTHDSRRPVWRRRDSVGATPSPP